MALNQLNTLRHLGELQSARTFSKIGTISLINMKFSIENDNFFLNYGSIKEKRTTVLKKNDRKYLSIYIHGSNYKALIDTAAKTVSLVRRNRFFSRSYSNDKKLAKHCALYGRTFILV